MCWAGFIMIRRCDLISSDFTSLLHFLFYSILCSPPHPLFSLHSTTPPQPLVLAPLPLLHLLLCPQMTAPAPPMSWLRSGYAPSGGCRTARAWMKSAKRVEVNICQKRFDFVFIAVSLNFHVFASLNGQLQIKTLSVKQ